jgi:hypothetical protein
LIELQQQQVLKGANKMKKEKAIECARNARKKTISELGYLIKELQKDYDRLVKAQVEDDLKGLTPQQGSRGYYLQQHCLRYEQTIIAAAEMEQWAMISEWAEA